MKPRDLFTLERGDILHYEEPGTRFKCERFTGPRGGIKENVTRVKVTSVKTWKRDPGRIEVRWQHGLYTHGVMTPEHAQYFHKQEDCPLNDPNDGQGW